MIVERTWGTPHPFRHIADTTHDLGVCGLADQ